MTLRTESGECEDHVAWLYRIVGEHLRTGTLPLLEADGPVIDFRATAFPEPVTGTFPVPWHPTEIQYYAAFRDGHVVECVIRTLT